jgi:hypothetical protein
MKYRRLTIKEHIQGARKLLAVNENFMGLHVSLIKLRHVRHARPFKSYLGKVRLDLDSLYYENGGLHPSPYYGSTGLPVPKPRAVEAVAFHRDHIMSPLDDAHQIFNGHIPARVIDKFIKLTTHAHLLGDFCFDVEEEARKAQGNALGDN